MKKKKPVQLDLFQVPTQSLEDEIFERFKSHAIKLIADGFFQIEEYWWRSRLHDMLYPGHNQAKTHEEWLYNHTAEKNWMLIWARLKRDIVEPHFKAIITQP